MNNQEKLKVLEEIKNDLLIDSEKIHEQYISLYKIIKELEHANNIDFNIKVLNLCICNIKDLLNIKEKIDNTVNRFAYFYTNILEEEHKKSITNNY